MPFRIRTDRAFTMVEIIVVVLISSILMTVGAMAAWRQIQDRQDAEVTRTLQAIDTEARQLASSNGETDPTPYLQTVTADVRLSAEDQARGWGVTSVDVDAGLVMYERNGVCGALLVDPAGDGGRIETWDCTQTPPAFADVSPTCTSPPASPTAPTATTGAEPGQLDVSWSDPDTDLSGYVVTVTGPGDGEGVYQVRDPDGSEPSGVRTSVTLNGLSPSTTYDASIASVRAGQCQSTAVTTTGTTGGQSTSTVAPTLQVTTSVGRAQLTWTRVDGATSYDVVRDGATVGTTDRDRYVDDGGSALAEGTYTWEVTAVFGGTPGETSSPQSAFVPGTPGTPGPPTLVEGDHDGDGDRPDIRISWGAVSGATDYVVRHCLGDGCDPTQTVATVDGATTSADHIDVTEGMHRYTVTAVTDLFGSNASGVSELEIVGTPDPPGNVLASAGDDNGGGVDDDVTLTWDPVATATSYIVYYCTGAGCVPSSQLATPSGTSLVHQDLPNGTHRYAVEAVTPAGNTGKSAAAEATVDVLPTPAAPTLQTTAASGSGGWGGSDHVADDIDVSWGPVTGAADYQLYWCQGLNCDPTDTASASSMSTAGATSVRHYDMAEDTWRYTVQARDSSRSSAMSPVSEIDVVPGFGQWATTEDTDPQFDSGQLAYSWFTSSGGLGYPTRADEMDPYFYIKNPQVTQGGVGVHTTSIEWRADGRFTHPEPAYMPDGNYGWVAHGYLYAPTAGVYEFQTDADDAAEVWVDGIRAAYLYGNNGIDGANSPSYTTSGTSDPLHLTEGWHRFQVRHMNGDASQGLAVGWKKPGDSSFATIPASSFGLPSASTDDSIFDSGTLFSQLYDRSSVTVHRSTETGIAANIAHPWDTLLAERMFTGDLSWARDYPAGWGQGRPFTESEAHFSWWVSGWVKAPTSGSYTFAVDGEGPLDVLVDGRMVAGWYDGHADLGGSGGPVYDPANSGDVYLTEGWHQIEGRFAEGTGAESFAVGWKKPGDSSFSTVPAASLGSLRANNRLQDDIHGYRVWRPAPHAAINPPPVTTTDRHSYTGSTQSWVVPEHISGKITVEAWGASGGGGAGGQGGYVSGDFAASPGDTLYIFPGEAGQFTGLPTYNGGGAGGLGYWSSQRAGDGGGKSDVRLNSTAWSATVLGGGGGGGVGKGYNRNGSSGTAGGGDGGHLTGQDGGGTAANQNGKGGSQTSGGTGGRPSSSYCNYCDNGGNGQARKGGDGGRAYFYYSSYDETIVGVGGGGGGGYYGGGGGGGGANSGNGNGFGGGGGGGASWLGSTTNTAYWRGARTGHGLIDVTYTIDEPAYPGPIVRDYRNPQLDGVSTDWIFIPHDDAMNITDLTVDATVTWDDPADDGGPTGGVSIIANREPLWEVGVWRGSGTLATAIRASGGGWKWYNTSHSLTPGVEAQVRVTYDGTNIRTYVDGTLVDTTAHAKGGPVDGSTDEAMHVGRREARTSTRWYGTFGGTLSDVAIMDGVHPPP